MTVISQQDEPEKTTKKKSTFFDSSDGEFEMVNSFKSLGFGGPPKYCDSPFSRTNKNSKLRSSTFVVGQTRNVGKLQGNRKMLGARDAT